MTGATGVVGRPILRRLVERGRTVVALARSEASRRKLEDDGARPVLGELASERALARLMEGCDVVFHVAGLNAPCVLDRSRLYATNVSGSVAVVGAAARAGVRRVVYTSSAATLGEEKSSVGHEGARHRGFFLSHYERSKFEAEQAVMSTAGARGVELVCVNPSSVQGPGRSGGTALIVRAYLNGKLRVFVDTRLSLVDVDDCAEGHLLAEAKGAAGQRYVLSGATLEASAALELVAAIAGVGERPRALPPRLAMAIAAAIEGGARIRRRDPPLCRDAVRTLLHGHAYDGSRATRELGLTYTPVEDTLRRTVRWLVDEGLVSRSLPKLPPSERSPELRPRPGDRAPGPR